MAAVLTAIGQRLFVIYVALNMLTCALILLPWAYPRETISGFIGRHAFYGKRVAKAVEWVVDRLYFLEERHCRMTYLQESEVRRALGYPKCLIF